MDPAQCPECGGPLQAGSDGEWSCPSCMLALGLDAAQTVPPTALPDPPDHDPESIGPYRILGKLGEGGMGTVYLAEQAAPVSRKVALKVVKHGIGTTAVIRRFDAERQALALMDHPSIARVYEAGETRDGLPYFAMEYVQGEPITDHCDRERLTTRERLELLVEVCLAVQHAHRKGVIHRDIKPSNVLVTRVDGKSVPKIIDFGIARAVEQRLTERSLFTELGMIVGTPEYMSPEQAEFTGERVDTRTDVYSLGVLQYELMTGALPFDPAELRAGGFEQICRRIREEEPSRPSARVSGAGEVAARSATLRGVDVATLRRQLAGDLDWVAMKALEKDPERRYGSPQELADDLRHYLRHEPVLAGPPSAAYRLRKFVRRNRAVVAGVVAVTIALVAGIVASTTFAVRESAQRRKAERARSDLEKVVDFQARMISDIDPAEMGERLVSDLRSRIERAGSGGEPAGGSAGTRQPQLDSALAGVNGTDAALRILDEEILGRAARVIETEFADEPLIEARLRLSLGTTYGDIGLYDRAGPHLDRSLELRRNELGDEDPDTLRSLRAVASNHLRAGRYDQAETALRAASKGMSRALGPDDAETLTARQSLGNVYRKQGRYDEAEKLFLEVLEARRRTLGPEALQTLDTMQSLAMVYGATGRHAQAESLLAEALEIRKRELGPDDPLTLLNIEQLAANQSNLGRLDEAEKLYLDLVEAQRRVRGSEHPDLIVTLNNLAQVYVAQGRLDDAVTTFTEALRIGRLRLGPNHLNNISMTMNLASVQQRAGHLKEAEALYLEGLKAMEAAVGPDHPSTLLTRVNLGIVYLQEGRHREAAEAIRAAAENARAPAQVKLQAALFFRRYASPRETATAVRYASQAVEMTGRDAFPSLQALASALADDGRIDESRSVWEEIVARPDAGPLQFNEYAWFLLTSAGAGPSAASTALEFALKAVEPPGDRNPDYLDTLALAYHRTSRDDKAAETIERALAILAPDDAARRGPFTERLKEYRAAASKGGR